MTNTYKRQTLTILAIMAIFFCALSYNASPSVAAEQLSTQNQFLIAQTPPELTQATFVDRLAPDTEMDLTLALKVPNRNQLTEFIQTLHDPQSPNYHHWLTPTEFGNRFGANATDYQQMVTWLQAQGLKVKRTWPNRLAIDFRGKVGQLEQLFNIEINHYDYQGRRYFAHSRPAQLPSQFAKSALTILGLENFSEPEPVQAQSLSKNHTGNNMDVRNGTNTAIAPKDFYKVYNEQPILNQGIDGRGQTIAIAARSDFNLSDVQQFRSTFGLAPNDPQKITPFGAVQNLGGVEELEVLLDVQLSGAVAPNATIQAIIAPTITQSIQSIYNDFSKIPIVSISFGLCEQRLMMDRVMMFDALYAQGVTQGQTTFVSSGDSGAADCGDGKIGVNGLASSANVIAVGATKLNAMFDANGDAAGYGGEQAWNNGGRSTGGGFSSIFTKPKYQIGAGVPADNKRAMPDIAMLGDPSGPGFFIVQGGQVKTVGGTSASSPAIAGVFSLVEQFNGNARLGNANFRIYALGANQAATGPSVYNDVVLGNNSVSGVQGFTAGPNYDQVSGWGSPNIDAFVRNFFTQQNNLAPVRQLQATSQSATNVSLSWLAPAMTPLANSFKGQATLDLAQLETDPQYQFSLPTIDLANSDAPLEIGNYHWGLVNMRKSTNRASVGSMDSAIAPATGAAPDISLLTVALKGKNKALANFTLTDSDGDLGKSSAISILLYDTMLKGVVAIRNGSLLFFNDKSIFNPALDFTGKTMASFSFKLNGLKGFPQAAIWASCVQDDAGNISVAPATVGISGRISGGVAPQILNSNAAIFQSEDVVGVNLDGMDMDADTVGISLSFLDSNNQAVFALGIGGDSGKQSYGPVPLDLLKSAVKGQNMFNVNFSISGLSKVAMPGTLKAVGVSLVDSRGNRSTPQIIPFTTSTPQNSLLRYNIYRSTSSPVVLNPLNLIGTVPAGTTVFTDSSSSMSPRYYVVTAVYSLGESPVSNEVMITGR